jgi:hypothetical protein
VQLVATNACGGLIASTACATVRRHLAAQIGGLACSRFDPRQRSVIFIHAVEVDHGLTSHLVGPDPLVSDQLISFSLSEFAIAATVLELDEPAPPIIIIVDHGSCMCFDDFRHNRINSRLSERGILMVALLSTLAYQEGAAFVVADDLPGDLFPHHLRVAQLPGMR